jgi:hypothetical protein
MSSAALSAGYRVVLHQRVIVDDDNVFRAEREMVLPFPPFVGLTLLQAEALPAGCDPSEDSIREVAYDVATGEVSCYLPCQDYRPEQSGSDDWTEEEIRGYYKDWKLVRDSPIPRPRVDRNGDDSTALR